MSSLTFHLVGPNQTQAGGVSRKRLSLLSRLACPAVSAMKDRNSQVFRYLPLGKGQTSRRQMNEQLGWGDQARACLCAGLQQGFQQHLRRGGDSVQRLGTG